MLCFVARNVRYREASVLEEVSVSAAAFGKRVLSPVAVTATVSGLNHHEIDEQCLVNEFP